MCVCVSVRQHAIVWVCGIQTTFLVFHWASRTLCMCAVWWNIVLYVWHMCSYNDIHSDLTSVPTVYAQLIRLCCSPFILLLTQSPYRIRFLKLITNPNANVKCAFTFCWFYMCMRVRMRECMPLASVGLNLYARWIVIHIFHSVLWAENRRTFYANQMRYPTVSTYIMHMMYRVYSVNRAQEIRLAFVCPFLASFTLFHCVCSFIHIHFQVYMLTSRRQNRCFI